MKSINEDIKEMLNKEIDFYLEKLKDNHGDIREEFSMSELRAIKQVEFLKRLDGNQIIHYFDNLVSNIIRYSDYVLVFSSNFAKDNHTEYLINSLEQKRTSFFSRLFSSKDESKMVPAQLKSLYSQITFYQNRINVIYSQMNEIKEQLFFSKSVVDIDDDFDSEIKSKINKDINNALPTLALLEDTVNNVKITIHRTMEVLGHYVEEFYPALFKEHKHLLISAVDGKEGFESRQSSEKAEVLKILKKTILQGIYEFKEYNAYYKIKELTIKSGKKASGAKNALMIQNKMKEISEKIKVFSATLDKYEKVLEAKIKELDQENDQNVEDKINNMPLISECNALLTEISILKSENKELLRTIS